MKNQRNHTRRALFAASASLMTPLVAGCLTAANSDNRSETTTGASGTTTIDDESPITRAYATGTHLVIELHEDRPVSQVNLIGPDGTAYARKSVARGARTLRIRLLEVDFGVYSQYHYTPGKHTIVTVTEDGDYQTPMLLRPSFRVLDVHALTDEEGRANGNLGIQIENVGSGPTWVYEIAYTGAPAEDANDPIDDYVYLPVLESHTESGSTLLAPGEVRTFVGSDPPFLVWSDSGLSCTADPFDFEMIVGMGIGNHLVADLSATLSGYLQQTEHRETCSQATVELRGYREGTWD